MDALSVHSINIHNGVVKSTALSSNIVMNLVGSGTLNITGVYFDNGIADRVFIGGSGDNIVANFYGCSFNVPEPFFGSNMHINAVGCMYRNISVMRPMSTLNGSASVGPVTIADGADHYFDLTINDVKIGDIIHISPPYDVQGLSYYGWVSEVDTVFVALHNNTGASVSLGVGTWRIVVNKNYSMS